MADVKWIKIVTDIFDDEKIMLIENMPEGDTILVIWFKLLALAGKQNNCGVFVLSEKIPYTDEMFSTIFRRPLPTVRLALTTFEKFGMVEIIENTVMIKNWEKHQSVDTLEKIKDDTRKRVQKHREKQKQIVDNTQCNVTVTLPVTQCNATEEDKEYKNKSKSIYSVYTSNVDLLSALDDFEKMRKSIKKPLTDKAKQMLLTELDKLSSDDETKIAILNQSIFHNWQGVFALKVNTSPVKASSTGNVFLDAIESGVFDE